MAQYDLIFEGGGAKGIVFVGALEEFEAREHKARRFMGTSAGAITAALMAAGYTPPEMLAAMEETGKDGKPRFTTFMDVPKEFREEVVARSLTYEIFHRVDLPGVPEWIEKRIDRFVFNRLMRLPAYRQLVSFVEKGGLFGGQAFLEWIREKLDAKREGWGAADFARFSEETGSDLSVVVTDTTAAEIRILNR
ncbi:MAG: patatin-like phospholipase family protein, partial [Acidobacteria bacterium]|nr:patatin-like phospholipase family protein [Acidobacteriota bacterium]